MSEVPQFSHEHILNQNEKWDYATFINVLISQAKHKDSLFPLQTFPKRIELAQDWHNLLNAMRNVSLNDNLERLALVGVDAVNQSVSLPSISLATAQWEHVEGTTSTIALNYQKYLLEEVGMEMQGVLHSHPGDILNTFFRFGRLSAGDLYHLLVGNAGSFIGVADGSINSFAFISKESYSPDIPMNTFHSKWENSIHLRADRIIANEYKLALYKGLPNKDLKRII